MRHSLYRFTSFLLLPVAALLLAMDLAMLLSALANPPMLLPVFMVGCVCIYVFTSFSFLNKGITRGMPCKPSLKDWIKVNAIVTAVFVAMSLVQAFVMLNDHSRISQLVDQALAMQGNGTDSIPKESLVKMMRGMLYVMAAISALLAVHIIMTLRLLKLYRHLFTASAEDPE